MRTAAWTPPDLRVVAIALLAGAVAAFALPEPFPVWVAGSLGVMAAAWMLATRRVHGFAVAILGFGLCALQIAMALQARIASQPVRHEAVVEGRVAGLPRTEPRRVVFDFDVAHADGAEVGSKRIRIGWYYDDVPPAVQAGERWRLAVRLKAPRGLRNPGSADAERHALADRLAAAGYVAGDARRLAAGSGMDAWRERTSSRIAAAVPRDSSRFVRALALGDTRALTERDWRLLRADGLTHLVAISGFHVGMVAGAAVLAMRALWWLLPVLGRRMPARVAGAVAGVAAAGVYAAAAGFSMPTIRTWLMIGIVALAQVARRSLRVSDALAIAAIAITLVDPLALLGAGFWLSFAGVAWLAWCLPRERGAALRGLARAQAVASIGLLPLTAFFFAQASLAGPLANLVAVPLWSLVVAPLAVAGVALDPFMPSLAAQAWRLAAWSFDVAWPLFERMGESPLALWWLPEPSAWAFPLALLGGAWMLLPRGVPGRALGLVLWLPLLWPSTHRPAPGEAEVTAIDVGQGLAVLVRTRSHALLYDAGPAAPDGFDAGERAVVPTLRARGVGVLDRLVLSHADNDHAGGLDAVRAEVLVRRLDAPEGAGVTGAGLCRGGQSWVWDGVRFDVLHPPEHFPYLANESSCVLRIATRHGAVLLTGDIGEVIERRLVAHDAKALRADVVFVGHHGSRHSSDPAFVAATGARHAIASTGHGNRFRHPAVEVRERWQAAGAAFWDTAEAGAITVRLERDGIDVSGRRAEAPRPWDAARLAARNAGLSYRRD